jgi:hypothetical protein
MAADSGPSWEGPECNSLWDKRCKSSTGHSTITSKIRENASRRFLIERALRPCISKKCRALPTRGKNRPSSKLFAMPNSTALFSSGTSARPTSCTASRRECFLRSPNEAFASRTELPTSRRPSSLSTASRPQCSTIKTRKSRRTLERDVISTSTSSKSNMVEELSSENTKIRGISGPTVISAHLFRKSS